MSAKPLRIINITPILPGYVQEVAADLRRLERDCGVTDAALMMPLGPANRDHAIDVARAEEYANAFREIRQLLAGTSLRVGILIQSTLGHGTLNRSALGKSVNARGQETAANCPLAPGLAEYLTRAIATVTGEHPAFLMVDDDFRLANFGAGGCYCGHHLDALQRATGRRYEREELLRRLPEQPELRKAWDAVRGESLYALARAIRRAIDSVDEGIPCAYCMCDASGTELLFARKIAEILAGKNPPFLRIADAWYYDSNSKGLIARIYWTAAQMRELRGIPEILGESDTYPHNRYHTPVKTIRAQILFSILNGCTGLKLWITRLYDHQPASGEAYRRMLCRNRRFFNELKALCEGIVWEGPATPLPRDFSRPVSDPCAARSGNWIAAVLAHQGIPAVVDGGDDAQVRMLCGQECDLYTDEELHSFLHAGLLLDGSAALKFCERGFADLIGADADLPEGWVYSHEFIANDPLNGAAVGRKIMIAALALGAAARLQPRPGARTLSTLFWGAHYCAEREEPVGSGCVAYENALGGRVVTFSAALSDTAFADEARREQLLGILEWLAGHPVPVCVESDIDIYALHGRKEALEILAFFNLSLDPLEEVRLRFGGTVPRRIWGLGKDGEWQKLAFRPDGERCLLLVAGLDSVDLMVLRLEA